MTAVVLDFETTGLSPAYDDRMIEVGAVRVRDGEMLDSFHELANPGRPISAFIAGYTGITNAELAKARPTAEVMADFAAFLGDSPVVAHNASFDSKFLNAELHLIGRGGLGPRWPARC
jgi:DNA polymerase-3 subunit epsilon